MPYKNKDLTSRWIFGETPAERKFWFNRENAIERARERLSIPTLILKLKVDIQQIIQSCLFFNYLCIKGTYRISLNNINDIYVRKVIYSYIFDNKFPLNKQDTQFFYLIPSPSHSNYF